MKLKETIPIYNVGDTVTIIDDLRNRKINDVNNDAGVGEQMLLYQSIKTTISRKLGDNRYELSNFNWSWSYNMFKESYDFEEEIIEPYIGMYLYHNYHDEGENEKIIMKVIDIVHTTLRCKYMFKQMLSAITIPENLEIHGITFDQTIEYSKHNEKNFFTASLYVPTNEKLIKDWGVSNKTPFKQELLTDGMLPIPDLFNYSKYPIRKVNGILNTGNSYNNYVFEINKTLFVSYDNFKTKSIKYDDIFSNRLITNKDYKELIITWGKAKIKSFDKSSSLFGHKTRKKAMFEAVNTNSVTNKKYPVYFQITNVIFNYEKEGKYYHVVEVYDGTLNLKFLLSDIELILPNVNNYIQPKDRVIKSGVECKVTKDKLLPVSKGSKVKVVKMFNRHIPLKGMSHYDKNTVCLVVDNNNKQFECKVKQLKKI
jgi:hypothetical protein